AGSHFCVLGCRWCGRVPQRPQAPCGPQTWHWRFERGFSGATNEFHLGFSKGKARGHALGPISAEKIWRSLIKSKAAKTGLVQDLEDTVLFVEGVGSDMLSDAICNIIRGPLIAYTNQVCNYYGITMVHPVDSGPVWNPQNERWEQGYVSLPKTKYGLLILVPKVIARIKSTFDANEYYRHYLMPTLQQHHKDINSAFVRTVRTGKNKGKKYVTKKDLYDTYGADKLTSAELTKDHPSALDNYRKTKRAIPSRPLDHIAFAKIENAAPPNFDALLAAIQAIPTGNATAGDYEGAVEKFLSAYFYPSLVSPQKQHEIHDGRKRIDIKYSNAAQAGFFSWLAKHYPAPQVFVECKNYGKEVGNPEVDQLAGRFSPSRGKFGLLVVRSVEDRARLEARCKDTAGDGRGFIIVLDDADLAELVKQRLSVINGYNDNLLWRRFQKLIN
ncbi:restriction endonuclease, partial [Xanthomonas phaseoli]|uniref:restriction endonuclease n=1 Tax=Xanthomonas phaseoli TaxID=1985254 RepID=UPI00193A4FDD